MMLFYCKFNEPDGRVKPARDSLNGGYGAWQLCLRLSSLDLNVADIRGGHQRNLALGLSWYSSRQVRLNTEYIKVLSIRGGAFVNAEPALFQTRLQIIF
ncbi:MAG: porin [Gammaproteobacteria bacterium]